MESENILEYLIKSGPQTTFRIARELGIKREKVLRVLSGLERKGLVEIRRGVAIPLKVIKLTEPKLEEEVKKVRKRAKPKIRVTAVKEKEISETRINKLEEDLRGQIESVMKITKAKTKELEGKLEQLNQKIEVIKKVKVKPRRKIRRKLSLPKPMGRKPLIPSRSKKIKKVKSRLIKLSPKKFSFQTSPKVKLSKLPELPKPKGKREIKVGPKIKAKSWLEQIKDIGKMPEELK